MKKTFVAVMTAIIFAVPMSRSQAVDVINEDAVPYVLSIIDDNDSRTVEIEPRQGLKNVCFDCVVSTDEDAINASGKEVVLIHKGRLSKEK